MAQPAADEDEGHDALGVVDALVQLSFAVQTTLTEVAAGADLSLLQARLLGVLRDRTPTMADLAEALRLDKSSATGLIDRAQRRGLVQRMKSTTDARSFLVELTAEGRRLTAILEEEMTGAVDALVAPLDPPGIEMLRLLASRVVGCQPRSAR